jgi:hypothetical protein
MVRKYLGLIHSRERIRRRYRLAWRGRYSPVRRIAMVRRGHGMTRHRARSHLGRVGLGPSKRAGVSLFQWVGPKSTIKIFSNIQSCSDLKKYKSCNSCSPKKSNFCQAVDKIKKNNFPFGKKLKFQMYFELKIQEANQILIWFEFEMGSNFLGGNPINPPKF